MSKAIQSSKPHLKKALSPEPAPVLTLSPEKLKLCNNGAFTPPRQDSDSPNLREGSGINSRKTEAKTKTTTSPNSNQETSDALNWAKKVTVNPNVLYSPKNYLYKIGIQKKNWMLFQTLNCSTKDCFLCAKHKGLRSVIKSNLNKKYLTSRESYDVKVVNDIIYNENTHLVAVFKDYLIYDDISEFMKRFYMKHESATRLPKVYDFYNKYSKVFPNYVNIEEKKFMFKNIERKQRLIDEQQKIVAEGRKKRTPLTITNSEIDDKIFTTRFIGELNKPDSILGRTLQNEMSISISMTQMQNYNKNKVTNSKKPQNAKINGKEVTNFDEISLHQLVEKFIFKDSQSIINISEFKSNPHSIPPEPNPRKPIASPAPASLASSKKTPNLPAKHTRAPSANLNPGSTRNIFGSKGDLKGYATKPQSSQKLELRNDVNSRPNSNSQSRNNQGVTNVFTSPKRATSANRISSPRTCTVDSNKYSTKSTKTVDPKPAYRDNISRSKSLKKPVKSPSILSSDSHKIPNSNYNKSKTPERTSGTRPASSLGTRNEPKKLTRQASLTNTHSKLSSNARTVTNTPRVSSGSSPLRSTRDINRENCQKGGIIKSKTQLDKKEILAKNKVLAIDIEALNKNLQKQKIALDTKMFQTAKSAQKEKPENKLHTNTSDQSKKFKSEYLNSLKNQIVNRLSMDEKSNQIRKEEYKNSKPLVGSILTQTKSVSSLTNKKPEINGAAQKVYQTKAFQGMSNKRAGEILRSPVHMI